MAVHAVRAHPSAVAHPLCSTPPPIYCRWAQLSYAQYAESVGVRTRVAMLQAHAQCATIASAAAAAALSAGNAGAGRSGRMAGGALCAEAVTKGQAPYNDQLAVLWGALVADWAVLTSQPPDVQEAHQ